MNHIYKIIWNKTTQSLVVVSELCKSQGKSHSSSSTLTSDLSSALKFTAKLTVFAALLLPALPSAEAAIAIGSTSGNSFLQGSARADALKGHTAYNYGNPGNRNYYNQSNSAIYSGNLNASFGVAIGSNATTVGDNTYSNGYSSGVAIGDYARATGGLALALGAYSRATHIGSTVIGTSGLASGFNSLAMMRQAAATSDYAMAIGTTSWANGFGSLAMGASATATGAQAIAIGSSPSMRAEDGIEGGSTTQYDGTNNTNATGAYSIALGTTTKASASDTIAIGRKANARAAGALAFGQNVTSSGVNSVAVGAASQATANGAIAIGDDSQATNTDALAQGKNTRASGNGSTAVGNSAKALANSSVALGNSANASQQFSTALGTGSKAYESATAVGNDAAATGFASFAASMNASASGYAASAIGYNAVSSNQSTIAFGTNSTAAGERSISLGYNTTTTNQDSVALSTNASAVGSAAVAIGAESVAKNTDPGKTNGATAIGSKANATGNQSVAIGAASKSGEQATAIGNDANAYGFGSIVIGGDDSGSSIRKDPYASGSPYGFIDTKDTYRRSVATGIAAVAVGVHAQSLSNGSTAIGVLATAGDETDAATNIETSTAATEATAIGALSRARNLRSTAIGYQTSSLGDYASAIGSNATANSTESMALGSNSTANGTASLAAGYNATTNGTNAVAIGSKAQALANNAISIGNGNIVSGENSGAIGDPTNITGSGTYSIGNNNGDIAANNSGVFGNNNNLDGAIDASRVIGNNSSVSASNAFVVGNESEVKGEGGVAVGNRAVAEKAYDMAIGQGAHATGTASTTGSTSSGSALAIGTSATADGTNAVGIGNGAAATNTSAIALGGAASGYASTALGYVTKASGTSSTAVGYYADATGDYGTAVGSTAKALGTSSIAVGPSANATALNSIAIGRESVSNEVRGVAIGTNANVTSEADDSIAMGTNATASGKQSVASGLNATASANNTVAIGSEANASGDSSFAGGMGAVASANSSTAVGANTQATHDSAVAIGSEAKALNDSTIAIGNRALADANSSVAVGGNAKATANFSTALGDSTTASGLRSVAVGIDANATATNAAAVGDSALAGAQGALALGFGTQANLQHSVALGEGSIATAGVNTDSAIVNGLTYGGFAGSQVNSTLSVGHDDQYRQIQKVAAGQVTATSTDAINGSQLYATQGVIGNVAKSVVENFGGDAEVDQNGNITFTNIGDTGENNIHNAVKAAKTEVKGGTNIAGVTESKGNNNQTVYTVNANGTTVSNGSEAITVNATNAGNNVTDYAVDLSQKTKDDIQQGVEANTTVNTKGITFAADSGMATERKLGETLAVNGDNDLINTTASEGKIEVAATDKLKEAVNNATTALQSWTAQVNGSNAKVVNQTSNTVDFIDGKNISITNDNGKIKVATQDDVTFNTVNAATFNAGDISISANGINAGGKQITNVANGTQDSDAVNLSQLNATNANVANNTQNITNNTNNIANNTQNITNNTIAINKGINFGNGTTANKFALGETINVKPSDNNLVVSTVTDGVELALANSITVGNVTVNDTFKAGNVTINNNGIDAGGQKITNVANGTENSDAVNFGQLKNYVGDNSYNWNLSDGTNSNAVPDDSTVAIVGSANGDSANTAGIVTALDGTNVSVDLSQKTKDDIQQGIEANTTVNTKGITFAADSGAPTERKLGETLAVNGDGDLINTTASEGKIEVAATDKLKEAVNNATNALQTVVTQIDGSDVKTIDKTDNKANFVTGDNIDLTNDGNGGIKIATKENVTFNTVNTTTFNAGDISISANGINAGGKQITNVANGTQDSDAVNLSQLNATNANVANNTQNITNNANNITNNSNAIANNTQNITNNTNNIANNTQNITNNTIAINKGINFGNGTTANKFALGETINVKPSDSNLVVSTVADGVELALADSITVGNVTVNDTFKAGNVTVNNNGIDAGGQKITNVANGTENSDAVNFGQLKEAVNNTSSGSAWKITANNDATNATTVGNGTVSFNNGTNTVAEVNGTNVTYNLTDNIALTDAGSVTIGNTTLNNGGINITGGANGTVGITDSGLNNGNNTITNVANGSNASDAVNIAQLEANTTRYYSVNSTVAGNRNNDGATGRNAMAAGANAAASGDNATAIGQGTKANSAAAIAIGNNANATSSKNDSVIAIGNNAQSTGSYTIAVGNNSVANHTWSMAMGISANAIGDYATALGSGSQATSQWTTALGAGANATASAATAVGANTTAGADGATVVGYNSSVTGANTAALGNNINVATEGSVVLGNNSAAATATTETAATVNNLTYAGFKGADNVAEGDYVSVGSVGEERQIKNVAPGNISSESTDAINGSQLYATQNVIGNVAKSVVENFGGNAAVDPNGNITFTNIGDTGENTVHDAIKHVSDVANTGWNVQANGDSATKVAPGDTVQFIDGQNIKITRTDKNITVATADDVNFNSVNTSTLTAGPVTINNSGIDAGSQKITNVTAGTNGTDAVNLDQLNQTISANAYNWNISDGTNSADVPDNGTVAIKGSADSDSANTAGIVTALDGTNVSVDLSDKAKDSLDKADSAIQTLTTSADGVVAQTLNKDDNNANFDAGKNIVLTPSATGIAIATADDVTFGTVNATMFKAGDVEIYRDGINAGNFTITNVAKGVNGTDAVNLDQLNATNATANAGWNLTVNGSNSSNVAPNATVDLANKDGNINITKDGNNVTFALNNNLTIGGKDGKDGSIGVKGEDGKDGITITKDAIVYHGVDGADGTSSIGVNGKDGKAGVDGENITRIEYTDSNGTNHTVATLGDGLKFEGNQGDTIKKKLNETLTVKGSLANNAAASAENLRVDSEGGMLVVKLAQELVNLTSATFVNGTTNTVINGNGVTINGGTNGLVSLTDTGLDNGNNTITNVAPGVNGTDAVNVDQLNTVNETANAGWNLTVNGGQDGSTIKPKDTVDLVNRDGNIVIDKSGNNVSFNLGYKLNIGTGANTVVVDGTTGTITTGNVSLSAGGLNNGNNTITNVAVGVNATDAVNVSQLNASTAANAWKITGNNDDANATTVGNQTVSFNNGTNTVAVVNGTNVTYNLADNIALTNNGSVTIGSTVIKDGNIKVGDNVTVTNTGFTAGNVSVITSGINAGGNTITNVAPGVNGTDAVNVDQLNTVNETANAGWNLTVNGGQDGSTIKPKDTVDLVNRDGNIVIDKLGNNVSFNLGYKLNIGTGANTVVVDGTTGTITTGNVSLSAGGLNNGNNTITNVAVGVNATDAVNVSQLNASTAANAWKITGNNDDANATTVGNQTVSFNNGTNTVAVVNGTNVTYNLADNIALTNNGSVTIGSTVIKDGNIKVGDNVTVTNTGFTAGNVSVTTSGINAGGNTITNVAPGVNATDAVNVEQLNAVNATANAGWNLTANGKDSSNVKPNATVDLANKDGNIKITKDGNNVTFDLSDKLNIGTGTNSVVIDGTTGKVSTGDVSLSKDGISAGNRTITNVAAGVNGTDAVNVNQLRDYTSSIAERPLTFAGDTGTPSERKLGSTVTVKGGVTDTTKLTDNNIGVVSDGKGTLNVKLAKDLTGLNSVTISNGSASTKLTTVTKTNTEGKKASALDVGGSQITNVAPGAVSRNSTDAVNGSQLHATNQQVIRNTNAINQVAGKIHSVDRKLRAGVAGALASGGLYHATTPGKSMVAAGAGTYRGESAIAVGYSRLSDNGKLGVKFSVNSNTRGDAGASASVGYQW